MENAAFGFDNIITATTAARLNAGSSAANLSVDNLQVPLADGLSSWQTESGVVTALDGAWMTIDAGIITTWRAFVLSRTSLSSTAEVRWRVGAAVGIVEQAGLVSFSFDEDYAAPGTGTYSFTRAGTSWRRKEDGTWAEAASGTPAIHHGADGTCLGMLLQRQCNNQIRNSRLEGGTVGAPGVPPTNCVHAAGGISMEVVAVGVTEDGLPGYDVRFYGTAAGATNALVWLEAASQIALTPGGGYFNAIHARVIAGNMTNITEVRHGVLETDAGLAIQASNYAVVPVNGLRLGEQRYGAAYTAAGATAWGRPYFQIIVAGAGAVDITFRLAVPDLGTGGLTVSAVPITAPAGAPGTATRNADVLTYTPASSFMSPAGAVTFYLQIALLRGGTSFSSGGLQIDDGTNNNRINLRIDDASGAPRTDWIGSVAGVQVVDTANINLGGPAYERLTGHVARSSQTTAFARWSEGNAPQTDTDILSPSMTRVVLSGSAQANIVCVRKARIFGNALTDGQCLALASSDTSLDPAYVTYDSGWMSGTVDVTAQQSLIMAPADATGRFARCDINDPTSPTGSVRVGIAYAGPVWRPAVNIGWESAFSPNRGADRSMTRGGQEHITSLWWKRGWDVTINELTASDLLDGIAAMEVIAAKGDNILFIPEPYAATVVSDSVFGLLVPGGEIPFTDHAIEARQWRARITERV